MATLLVIHDSGHQRAQIRAAVEAVGLFGEIFEARDGLKGPRILLEKSVVVCRLELAGLGSSMESRPVD
ncbi:MAG: hypothetical protein GY910_17160 [bacterium]|nr:hypothetical protein [bacterium]